MECEEATEEEDEQCKYVTGNRHCKGCEVFTAKLQAWIENNLGPSFATEYNAYIVTQHTFSPHDKRRLITSFVCWPSFQIPSVSVC